MLTKISRKKQVLWRAAPEYASFFISLLNAAILVPLYLKYFELGLYGAWLATGNILVWLTIIDPGIGDVLLQKVSESYAKNDRIEIGKQLASSMILSFIITIIALFCGLILMFFIENIVKLSSSIEIIVLKKAFFLMVIATAMTLFSYFISGAVVGLQRSKEHGISRMMWRIISFIMKPILLFSGFGLLAIPCSSLIAVTVYLFILIFVFFKVLRKEKIKLIFDSKFLRSYSKIFIYTFSSKIFSTFKNNIDLILISRFLNVEMVVTYDLTRRPMRILFNLLGRPSAALISVVANLKGEGNDRKTKNIVELVSFLMFVSLILLTSGIIAFNRDLISLWIGHDLFIGQRLNILIALFFMVSNLSYMMANLTYALGNIKGNSLIEILRDVIALFLMIILGYYLGIWGIVISQLIVVIFIDLTYFPKKLGKLIGVNNVISHSLVFSGVFISMIGAICSIFFYNLSIINWGQLILHSVLFTVIFLISSYSFSKQVRQAITSTRMMLVPKS